MKVLKIILISILLFLVKTIATFFIDYFKLIDASAKFFPRDPETGGFWGFSKVYVALEFIYGIWIYIAVLTLFYFLTKLDFLSSWPKKFWTGFLLVLILYLIYSAYEEPIIINYTLRQNTYRGLNMIFVKGVVTYTLVALSMPVLSKKIKLI